MRADTRRGLRAVAILWIIVAVFFTLGWTVHTRPQLLPHVIVSGTTLFIALSTVAVFMTARDRR
jgi:hypothetical protein